MSSRHGPGSASRGRGPPAHRQPPIGDASGIQWPADVSQDAGSVQSVCHHPSRLYGGLSQPVDIVLQEIAAPEVWQGLLGIPDAAASRPRQGISGGRSPRSIRTERGERPGRAQCADAGRYRQHRDPAGHGQTASHLHPHAFATAPVTVLWVSAASKEDFARLATRAAAGDPLCGQPEFRAPPARVSLPGGPHQSRGAQSVVRRGGVRRLVAVFQRAGAMRSWGFSTRRPSAVAAALFAVLFGLSMDYHVFLLEPDP